jgi:hypothetical protein
MRYAKRSGICQEINELIRSATQGDACQNKNQAK